MTQAGGIYSPGSSLFYSGVGVVLFTAPRGAPHHPTHPLGSLLQKAESWSSAKQRYLAKMLWAERGQLWSTQVSRSLKVREIDGQFERGHEEEFKSLIFSPS